MSNVELLDVDGDARAELIVCDMRHGMVWLGRPYHVSGGMSLVARLAHPDTRPAVDLDRDGISDLLIADLGEFLPRDHDKGGFVWLRGLPAGGFAGSAIGGLPRVADVEAADFDGDGDLDLLVARSAIARPAGAVLENRTTDWASPAFAPHTIDPRPGAIHALPVDLDGDGRMDFVAVLVAGARTGGRVSSTTGPLTLHAAGPLQAPHPNWGSSGMCWPISTATATSTAARHTATRSTTAC